MCFMSAPKAPAVQAAPSRDTSQAAVVDARRRAGEQQGVYGNIFTSTLGDAGYNTSTRRPAAFGVGA